MTNSKACQLIIWPYPSSFPLALVSSRRDKVQLHLCVQFKSLSFSLELTQSAGKVPSANTDSPLPTKSCVSKIIKKWRTTSSGLDKTQHREKTAPTDGKPEDIWRRIQISPWKSLNTIITGDSHDCKLCF